MYCRQCGYNNDNYSRMCKRCGSNLREQDEFDDFLTEPEDDSFEREGGLRLAPRKEKFSVKLKKRFGKLRRASEKYTSKTSVIAAAIVILAVIAAFIIISAARSCSTETVAEYANDCSNIMYNCFAVNDDVSVYYSVPYGSNTGLYRRTIASGQDLKITYHALTCMSLKDGWIYGIDSGGEPLRISKDGTVTQYICDDSPVSYLSVVDNYCYFISSDHLMYRACLDALDAGEEPVLECLSDQTAGSMLLGNDRIYFTTLTLFDIGYDSSAQQQAPVGETPSGSSAGSEAGNEASQIITPESTASTTTQPVPSTTHEDGVQDITSEEMQEVMTPSYTPVLTPVVGVTGAPMGALCSMNFDGSDEQCLLDAGLYSISLHGDYIYFLTESTKTVSYSDIHPEVTETTKTSKTRKKKKTTTTEPPPKNIDVQCIHSWRYSLRTNSYAAFLADDQAASPIYVTTGAIYYISPKGDLMTASLAGMDERLIPTGLQQVDTLFVLNDYVYFTSDSESFYGRIQKDGVHVESLSERGEIEMPEPKEDDEAAAPMPTEYNAD